MNNISNQIFNKALQNEVYVDSQAFVETKLNNIIKYKIFRPFTLADRVKKHPSFYVFLFKGLNVIWGFLNFIFQTLMLFNALNTYRKSGNNQLSDRVVIVATPRLIQQLEKISIKAEIPTDYVFVGSTSKLSHHKNKGVYSYVNLKDLWWSYKKSIASPYTANLKPNEKVHTIVAFDWFLCYRLLHKNSQIKEIWFGNHFDRWAVLFSHLPIKKKVLVQHGIANGLWIPPNKFSRLSKVFLIDSNQQQHFAGKLITEDFQYELLESKLELTNILDEEKLRVLIVGNSGLHLKDEDFLVKNLQHKGVQVALKPHPVLSPKPYLDLRKSCDFVFIEDKNVFPIVDLLISYESTLAVEYEQKGVEVYYYQQHSTIEIVEQVLQKVKM